MILCLSSFINIVGLQGAAREPGTTRTTWKKSKNNPSNILTIFCVDRALEALKGNGEKMDIKESK